MTIPLRRFYAAASLVTLVGCDHATKHLAKAELEHHQPRELIRSALELRYVENTDVAFNVLHFIPAGVRGPLLLTVGALAVALLGAVLWRRINSGLAATGFVLILAGALGNYADRVMRGYVVDFIHVQHWPVFNVADICVTVGAIILAWSSLRPRHTHPA